MPSSTQQSRSDTAQCVALYDNISTHECSLQLRLDSSSCQMTWHFLPSPACILQSKRLPKQHTPYGKKT